MYLKFVFKTINVVSGSTKVGLTEATAYWPNCVSISVLSTEVKLEPSANLTDIKTLPYWGVELSSPPHTWIAFAAGYICFTSVL